MSRCLNLKKMREKCILCNNPLEYDYKKELVVYGGKLGFGHLCNSCRSKLNEERGELRESI